MEGMKYGYARVSTDDQTPALPLAALKKAGCKTIFKDDGLSGAATKRPALLRRLKKLGTRRHAHGVEARPVRPQLARPDSHARRPEKTGREIPIAYRSDRHRDAHGSCHVADDWRAGRAGAQPDQRTDPRRSEGRERPRREIRAQTKAGAIHGQRREEVAALLNVNRTTLYRALAG